MTEKNYDVDAFPTFHPSGKFGLNQPRKIKISDQEYFAQRILNKDARFRNSKKYLFSAVYRIERKQLESQIRMSFRKGFVNNNNLLRIEDGFHMFDKIPGRVTRFRLCHQFLYKPRPGFHGLESFYTGNGATYAGRLNAFSLNLHSLIYFKLQKRW